MRFLLLTLLFGLTLGADAQPQNLSENYIPLACDTNVLVPYLELTTQRWESDLEAIKSKPKVYREDLGYLYSYRYRAIKSCYKKNLFYSDTLVVNYFQRILNVILDANPQLPNDIRLTISRHLWANASSYGEGSIVFHLELLRWSENESQLAFYLCHEIAHYIANHGNNGYDELVTLLNDPEYQKTLKELSKVEYNMADAVIKVLKPMAYDDRRHSRQHESEADSIAITLLRNTPYSEIEALRALEILDILDEEVFDTINWPSILNSGNYPFKNSWIAPEGGLASFGRNTKVDMGDLDKDSLKTHPDCQVRIALIQNYVESGPHKKIFVQGVSEFETLKAYSRFERVSNMFFQENYAGTIFLATDMLTDYPENAYLIGLISQCWLAIYNGIVNHEMGKYVDLPGSTDIYSYNQLLILLNRLRISEMSKLAYNYLLKYEKLADNSEELTYSLMQFSKKEGNVELYVQLQNRYKRNFPEGKYISKL